MIKLGKEWYLESPIRWPLRRWSKFEVDLPEKMYNAVIDAMMHEERGTTLECAYCHKKLAYVVILKKYENFPVTCITCLVGS
jgi:DNA relaxase NicK